MTTYKLADWTVCPESNELVKNDQAIKLEQRVMEVLVYFCQHPNRVIGREELIEAVWGRIALSPNSLNVAIGAIRNALGDDAKVPVYLETVQKRGYRLLVEVKSIDNKSNPVGIFNNWKHMLATVGVLLIGFFAFSYLNKQNAVGASDYVIVLAGIENGTEIATNDKFAGALGDLFIAELAQHKDVTVRKLAPGDDRNLASESLIVTTITGRLMRNDEELHLTLYLTADETGEILWAHSQPVDREHYLPGAQEIAVSLFEALRLDVNTLNNIYDNSIEAQYRRARDLAGIRSDVTLKAAHIQTLEILKLKPEFGPAHALLARLYYRGEDKYFWGIDEDPAVLAVKAADDARRFGADEAELLVLKAIAAETWKETREIMNEAVEVAGDNAWVYRSTEYTELFFGNFKEALARNSKALEFSIDPSSALSERIWPLYFDGQIEKASELCDLTRQRGILPVYYAPQAAILLGDQVKGFERWVDLIRAHDIDVPDTTEVIEWVRNGEIARAYQWLHSHTGTYRNRPSYAITLAVWHLSAGNVDLAMETLLAAAQLPESYTDHYIWNLLQFDPFFDGVRDDPRWPEIYAGAGVVDRGVGRSTQD